MTRAATTLRGCCGEAASSVERFATGEWQRQRGRCMHHASLQQKRYITLPCRYQHACHGGVRPCHQGLRQEQVALSPHICPSLLSCLPAFLPTCLPSCPLSCLPTFLLIFLPSSQPIFLPNFLSIFLITCATSPLTWPLTIPPSP